MKMSFFLIPFLIIMVTLLVRAEILLKRRQIYFMKPISTLLVIAIAALSFAEPTRNMTYSIGILIGLALSFGGDMALVTLNRAAARSLRIQPPDAPLQLLALAVRGGRSLGKTVRPKTDIHPTGFRRLTPPSVRVHSPRF